MTDIFVSYASGDLKRVEPLANALEAAGYSVWWDSNIQGGEEFSGEIEKALQASKAVVVVWSKQSLTSHWVKDEAAYARDHNILLPICLDNCEPPMGFRQHQTIDFSNWRGDSSAPAFVKLESSLASRFGGAAPTIAVPDTGKGAQKSIVYNFNRTPILFAGIAVTAIAALFAAMVVMRGAGIGGPDRGVVQAAISEFPETSIAVLPFVSMSESKEDEFFADGLSEELLNVLTNIESLKVAARTSSFYYKGKNDDLRRIGETLGVKHVLEGSVRRSGDQLRITAQLISVDDGYHLWSETYDRTMNDIFEIQDDISRKVANALKVTLFGEEETVSEEKRESIPEAQRLFLIAQAKLSQRGLENLRSARQLFQDVIELDPSHARAHIGYANATYLLSNNHADLPAAEAIAEAKRAAGVAVGLDPDGSDVYATFGLLDSHEAMMNGDISIAQKALGNFEQALMLNPRNVQAIYWYAIALEQVDEMEQALATYEHALSIDPLARVAHYRKGALLMQLGRHDDAEDQLLDTLALFPDYLPTQGALSDLEKQRGKLDRAVYWANHVYQANPQSFVYKAQLATRMAELGETDAALKIVEVSVDDTSFTSNYLRGLGYVILSDYQAIFGLALKFQEQGDDKWKGAAPVAAMIIGDLEKAQELFKDIYPKFYADEIVFARGGVDPEAAFAPAYVEQSLGNEAHAKKLIDAAMAAVQSENSSYHGQRRHGVLVLGYALLGDKDAALKEFKAAYDAGYRGGWISGMVRPDSYPLLEALRGEPQFQAIMDRISVDVELQRKDWNSGKTARDIESELKARGLSI